MWEPKENKKQPGMLPENRCTKGESVSCVYANSQRHHMTRKLQMHPVSHDGEKNVPEQRSSFKQGSTSAYSVTFL